MQLRRAAACGHGADWYPCVVPGMYISQRRSVGRYECCSNGEVWGVTSGWGPPVPRHSYGGHGVQLLRASDWQKNSKKRLKIKQSRQTRAYVVFIRPNSGAMGSGPMAGIGGCIFDLISERTGWPQRDQVHLFLAAAREITTDM